MPEFIHAANAADVPDPGKILVEVEGEMIALFHVNGSFYAMARLLTVNFRTTQSHARDTVQNLTFAPAQLFRCQQFDRLLHMM